MDPVPPPIGAAPRRSWWSRNWKWFVPTGCLSIIIAIVAFTCAIVFFVFGMMKSSDAYKTAMARAKSNPAAVEALGTPLKEGWFISGSTHVEGPGGEANMAIPVSGPKGKGTIYVVATRAAGRWNYTTLELEVSGRTERINLLDGAGSL